MVGWLVGHPTDKSRPLVLLAAAAVAAVAATTCFTAATAGLMPVLLPLLLPLPLLEVAVVVVLLLAVVAVMVANGNRSPSCSGKGFNRELARPSVRQLDVCREARNSHRWRHR